jgi:hypothetical protein
MLSSPVLPGGGQSVNLHPSGAARTQQSAATADACAPLPTTTEVTPILAPLQKSMPQEIGNGSTSTIPASINAAALANSGDDNVEYSSYCLLNLCLTLKSMIRLITNYETVYLSNG